MMVGSEGEEFLEDFFEEVGIDFEREKKIEKLEGDYASYRVADFYLPNYGVYVEFLGKWDDAEGREKYRKKKEIYKRNNIPCVYLYPDNLGNITWIFRNRLRRLLFDRKQFGILLRYEIRNFIGEYFSLILVLIGLVILFRTWMSVIVALIVLFIVKLAYIVGVWHRLKNHNG